MDNCKVFVPIIIVIFCLLPVSLASGKNLGPIGKTYPIVESDLVEEIKGAIDYEKLAKVMAEERRNYQVKDIHALPTAKRDRTFFIDMTYTLGHDIVNGNGQIIYPRGLTWNPLDYVSLPNPLVVINSEDAKQVEWFLKSPYNKNRQIKLLISGGFAAPLMKQLDRPVFYLTKTIADRLQLAAAPCVITQNGKKMMVQEIKIDE